MKLLTISAIGFLLSGCGIEIHEEKSGHQKKGTLTVVNETHRDEIRAEVSLAPNDSGYVHTLYAEPNSRATRRFQFSHSSCDLDDDWNRCERKIKFYKNGNLKTYCYGKQVLQIDYRCHEGGCEPLQDTWRDIDCHHID